MASIEEVKKLFTERIRDFASENGCKHSEIKVLIFFAKDVEINLYVGEKFIRKLDIAKDILKLKLDLMFQAQQTKMIFGVLLSGFCNQLEQVHGSCTKEEVRMLIFTEADEPVIPLLQLYKEGDTSGGRYVDWDEFSELF